MKLDTIQNRRDFLKSLFSRGKNYFSTFTGIIILEQNSFSILKNECPDNIPCSNCYKMGICEKDEAEQARKEVKRDSQITKIPKGVSYV